MSDLSLSVMARLVRAINRGTVESRVARTSRAMTTLGRFFASEKPLGDKQ